MKSVYSDHWCEAYGNLGSGWDFILVHASDFRHYARKRISHGNINSESGVFVRNPGEAIQTPLLHKHSNANCVSLCGPCSVII